MQSQWNIYIHREYPDTRVGDQPHLPSWVPKASRCESRDKFDWDEDAVRLVYNDVACGLFYETQVFTGLQCRVEYLLRVVVMVVLCRCEGLFETQLFQECNVLWQTTLEEHREDVCSIGFGVLKIFAKRLV